MNCSSSKSCKVHQIQPISTVIPVVLPCFPLGNDGHAMVAVTSTAHGLVTRCPQWVAWPSLWPTRATNSSSALVKVPLTSGKIMGEHRTFRHLLGVRYLLYLIYDLYMIYICILYIYNTLIYLWVLMDFQAAPDSRLPPLMVDPTGSFSFVVQPVSASEQGRNPAAPLGEIHSLPWKITIFKKPHIGYIGKSSIKASIKHI